MSKEPTKQRAKNPTRFDAPHPTAGKLPASSPSAEPSLAEAVAGIEPSANAEQLHGQANEIAKYLLEKQRELDQRENELRTSMPVVSPAGERGEPWPAETEQATRETAKLAAGAPGKWTEALAEQQRRLTEAEAILRSQRAQLAENRAQIEAASRAAYDVIKLAKQQLAASQACFERDQDAATRLLTKQREELRKREAASQRLREDAFKARQETLELRLMLEETWLELHDAAPPDVVVRRVATARDELAEHFSTTARALEQHWQTLQQSTERLGARADELREQRAALSSWLESRQAELDNQAAQLQAREAELEREQQQLKLREQRWASERDDLRARVAQLLLSAPQDPSPNYS